MHGDLHWNELNTHNPKVAMAFYGKVAGWTFDHVKMEDDSDYWVCNAGDDAVAGILTLQGEKFDDQPDNWLTYIIVEDVDAACKAAVEAGAAMLRDPWDVPSTGRFAVLRDPGGAMIAWMTPDPSAMDEDDDEEDDEDSDDDADDNDEAETDETTENDEAPKKGDKEYSQHN